MSDTANDLHTGTAAQTCKAGAERLRRRIKAGAHEEFCRLADCGDGVDSAAHAMMLADKAIDQAIAADPGVVALVEFTSGQSHQPCRCREQLGPCTRCRADAARRAWVKGEKDA